MATVDDLHDPDLPGEISEECAKYGTVVKVLLWRNEDVDVNRANAVSVFVEFGSAQGKLNIYMYIYIFVYMRHLLNSYFCTESEKAVASLNGRWFGGNRIIAMTFSKEKYLEFAK